MLPNMKGNRMSNYNKFIGTIVGGIVGLAFSYIAINFGLGTCVTDALGNQSCTVFGISDVQATGILTGLIASLGTLLAPSNKPTV